MKIPEVVGQRMRQARKDLRLSQAELGEQMGWYLEKPWFPQAVSEAEAGRRNFTAEELFVLAMVIHRPVSWFFLPLPHQGQTSFDLPRLSFKPDEVEIADGPLLGAGSVRAALTAEGQAMAEAMRDMARMMEFRALAFIELNEQLGEGEVQPRDAADRPDELAPEQEAGEA